MAHKETHQEWKESMSPFRRAAHEVCDARWASKVEGWALLEMWVLSLTPGWSTQDQALELLQAKVYLQEMCPETFDPQNRQWEGFR